MKKLVSLILCGTMVMGLAGCADSGAKMETSSSIVASVNGENITREDIGESLTSAEDSAIRGYVQNKLISDFFADVEVSDEEVELQISLMKAQVGEEQWPLYLTYYGGGSEESFKEMMKETLRQETYIQSKIETLTITDEELAEVYNQNPDGFNIAKLDAVFFGDAEQLSLAKEQYNNGSTMDEIATYFETEVYQDEHTYFTSEIIWETPLNSVKVGDIVFTTVDSGTYAMGKIKELNKGLDNPTVKKDLQDSLAYEKAYSIVDEEVGEYLKTQKVVILGEEISLVEETVVTDSETLTGVTE